MISPELESRKYYRPDIDLETVIETASRKKSLIVTIPWVTKYLSMLDYVTLRLEYLNRVFKLLFQIYINVEQLEQSPINLNEQLIRLCIGWLLELEHFPGELYFKWLSERTYEIDVKNKDTVTEPEVEKCLDDFDTVDHNILYICCPYLFEFRKLFASGRDNRANISKHVTPLTAFESSSDIASKRIKIRLEEEFFKSQPVSLKKTVEFTSERIASTCVKQVEQCHRP